MKNPQSEFQFIVPGQARKPLVTNKMREDFRLSAEWAEPYHLRHAFPKGHEKWSWYQATRYLAIGKTNAIWERRARQHFCVVMHPQIAKLVVSKDKVWMIFELPDNEIWKYPYRT